ncbi:MAG: hypothetical protein ACYCXU_02780 [Thermoleophilia bacterium]
MDNQFMITIIEQGLIGSVFIAGAFVLIGRRTGKTLRADREIWVLAMPIAVSIAAVLLIGMTSIHLFVWPNMVVF